MHDWQQLTGLKLRPSLCQALDLYVRELAEWNQKFNLISRASHLQVQHFLDSLQVAPFVLQQTKKESKCVYDIGSGAGFPGLVLAAYEHHQNLAQGIRWGLVEANQKKASFLRHMVQALNLKNIQIFSQRLESLPPRSIKLALSRGLKVQDLLKHIKTVASPQCQVLFIKGPQAEKEISQLEARGVKAWSFKIQNHSRGHRQINILIAKRRA